MAIAYATLINSLSTASFGTGSAPTASFTPTANRQLLAIAGGQENNGSADPSGDFTNFDSQGLTWTKVGEVGNASNWSHGLAAWISTPAAAAAMTVSFDCLTRNIYRYFYAVLEFDGGTGATAGYVETSASTTDGAYSPTLTVAPGLDDLTVFARLLDSSTTTLSMGGGWTVVMDQSDGSGGGSMAVAVRPTSTSTSVSVSDTNVAGVAAAKASDMAFVISAASLTRPVVAPMRAAVHAASYS